MWRFVARGRKCCLLVLVWYTPGLGWTSGRTGDLGLSICHAQTVQGNHHRAPLTVQVPFLTEELRLAEPPPSSAQSSYSGDGARSSIAPPSPESCASLAPSLAPRGCPSGALAAPSKFSSDRPERPALNGVRPVGRSSVCCLRPVAPTGASLAIEGRVAARRGDGAAPARGGIRAQRRSALCSDR